MKNLIFLNVIVFAIILVSCSKEKTTNPNTTTEYGTVTDIDGQIYKTVKICNQWWMAENLNLSHYSNGDSITEIKDSSLWDNHATGVWCYYNNDPANGTLYGKLYNWRAVNDSRGLAPNGWHIPSDAEWTELVNCLGGVSLAGGKMKETGTLHWHSPNTGATNESGFSALPGGWRVDYDGSFSTEGDYGYWWSSTEYDYSLALGRGMGNNYIDVGSLRDFKELGFSVRCLKDN